ncbi:hypothetical protein [Planosporangium mesophilum]|uniref:hypothetical protein n=1 Tax=Planosporangium mesophilum TaxID=689768 RepID=UPI001438EE90|nr:hypothetical protein [Planosporangium mesophilum]NJC84197.1 hypothetical protein [Planosporangium mesophilum]
MSGRYRRLSYRRRAVAALAVLVGAVVVAGCSGGRQPLPQSTADSPPSVPTGTTSASASAGPTYNAIGLDVCTKTDSAQLATLSLTVDRAEAKQPTSGAGDACQFSMHTADGHKATLLVEASTPPSIEEAQRLFRSKAAVTVMSPEGPIMGLGDEAEAFSKQSQPGYKYSEYLMHARSGNLVVKVWLAVGGNEFTPKATLAATCQAIVKATLSAVPRS